MRCLFASFYLLIYEGSFALQPKRKNQNTQLSLLPENIHDGAPGFGSASFHVWQS